MKRLPILLALSLLPVPALTAAELPAPAASPTRAGTLQLDAWNREITAARMNGIMKRSADHAEADADAARAEAQAAVKAAAEATDGMASGDVDPAIWSRAAEEASQARSRARAAMSKAADIYLAAADALVYVDRAADAFRAAQDNAFSLYALAPGESVADRRAIGGSEATRAPVGWPRFCTAYPSQCVAAPDGDGRPLVLTASAWRDMAALNRWVNASVTPITDKDHWGVDEKWSLPTADDMRGDCEDYVLLKRKLLVDAGWPVGALLVTVVRDLNNTGHAVLLVRTDIGDFVLDNERDPILLVKETGYAFIKRQSENDPNAWVYVRSPNTELAGLFPIRPLDTRREILN